jgi:hypothetical protein
MGSWGGSYGGSLPNLKELYMHAYSENSSNRAASTNAREPQIVKEMKIPTSSMVTVVQAWVDRVLGPNVCVKRVEEKDGEVTITLE